MDTKHRYCRPGDNEMIVGKKCKASDAGSQG